MGGTVSERYSLRPKLDKKGGSGFPLPLGSSALFYFPLSGDARPLLETKKGKGIPMQDTLAYNCVDYREKGKTYLNQPRLFLTARPPRYREKGKTYPVSNRAIITLLCFLPR